METPKTMTTRNAKLSDLVSLLEGQSEWKADLVVPAGDLSYVDGRLSIKGVARGGNPVSTSGEFDDFLASSYPAAAAEQLREIESGPPSWVLDPVSHFDNQVADRLDIPVRYFRRMRTEALDLLDKNVNGWLSRQEEKSFLVRAFNEKRGGDPVARAFLSGRYRVIDNYEVLIACLDAIRSVGLTVQVESCDLTETRMYVRVTAPELSVESYELAGRYAANLNGKPVISAGLVISNSEVGKGSFQIVPRLVVEVCKNGMTRPADAMKKIHLGVQLDQGSVDWSDDTLDANGKLIREQTADAVRHFLSHKYLIAEIGKILEQGDKVLEHPSGAVAYTCKGLGISDAEKKSVLAHFMDGGDRRAIGVVQAVTRFVQDIEDADRANDIETAAFEILPNIARDYDKIFKN